jgi:hypothetical protein
MPLDQGCRKIGKKWGSEGLAASREVFSSPLIFLPSKAAKRDFATALRYQRK